ncbi:hypothetical protein G5I_00336 [Acromyrmex echinatior]|uniref:Uncharacterized protein n=1 Tax=Acromyrmex echinatior TaxID=103372 RepID=F4W4L5_ACREC|nr:hypothetical protein G5I_00336 [Acromyrmex echinatior]
MSSSDDIMTGPDPLCHPGTIVLKPLRVPRMRNRRVLFKRALFASLASQRDLCENYDTKTEIEIHNGKLDEKNFFFREGFALARTHTGRKQRCFSSPHIFCNDKKSRSLARAQQKDKRRTERRRKKEEEKEIKERQAECGGGQRQRRRRRLLLAESTEDRSRIVFDTTSSGKSLKEGTQN